MRITKQIAEQVSVQMLAKKKAKLDQLRDQLSKELYQECLKTIPPDVLDMYPNYPDFFMCSRYCKINGYSHDISKYLPSAHGTHFKMEMNEKIKSILKSINEKEEEFAQLKREIYNVVLSAKTLNNLKKIMPKAVEFIKVEGDLLLPAVNI